MPTELIASVGDLERRQAPAHGERLAPSGPRLAAHEFPRMVALVAELPETASGKVQRYLLRTGG
jgi:acyl-CoA synthetase (AMP-forming)/AMP-acid ligase II